MINDGEYFVYGANGVIGKYSKFNHEESEILLTCRGATCGEVNISLPKSWINGNAMVIHPIIEINNKYLYFIASQLRNEKGVISGTAQPQITRTNLKDISFPLPPLAEQQRIVDKIEELFAQLDAIENSLQA